MAAMPSAHSKPHSSPMAATSQKLGGRGGGPGGGDGHHALGGGHKPADDQPGPEGDPRQRAKSPQGGRQAPAHFSHPVPVRALENGPAGRGHIYADYDALNSAGAPRPPDVAGVLATPPDAPLAESRPCLLVDAARLDEIRGQTREHLAAPPRDGRPQWPSPADVDALLERAAVGPEMPCAFGGRGFAPLPLRISHTSLSHLSHTEDLLRCHRLCQGRAEHPSHRSQGGTGGVEALTGGSRTGA